MAGVESTGFVRKPEADCIQEIIDECRATVDTDYDDSPDSVTGGFAAIIGGKHAELWEVLEAVHGALSPNTTGVGLDRVMAFTGSKRKPAQPTLLAVNLTGTDGTYAAGTIALSVDGQPSVGFTNQSPLTIAGGVGAGTFVCSTTGPVRVATGMLGPNVTSFSTISVGSALEADALARLRRVDELADTGTSTEPALRAALSKLANVVAPRVYSNRSFATDGDGRPPKSIEALLLVLDTSPAALQPIADTIWNNLPAGIETYGTTTVSVTDEEGHPQNVKFSLATEQNLYCRISLRMDPASYPGDQAVQTAISEFTSGQLILTSSDGTTIDGLGSIGTRISGSKVAAAALAVPGVLTVTSIGFTSSLGLDSMAGDFPLNARSYLGSAGARGFLPERVIVTAVPG